MTAPRALTRLAAVLAVAGAVTACADPVAVPPPPSPLREVKPPPDLILVDSAVDDLRVELDRAHAGPTPLERFYMAKGAIDYASVRAHYAARLQGWRAIEDFPNRTRSARSAAWRAGGKTFAFALIADPDRARPRGEETLLVTLGPDPDFPSLNS